MDARTYFLARELLMSGPRTTPPKFRAIRKMMGRLRRGDKTGPHGWSPWRSAPRISDAVASKNGVM